MRLGIDHAMTLAEDDDYLLMLNDDVSIGDDYVSSLVKTSQRSGGAMVGSPLCDEENRELVSSGSHIDYCRMAIDGVVREGDGPAINALTGRGVLIPAWYVRTCGNIRSTVFPHYYGDIEYTARIHEHGCPITVSADAKVYSSTESSDSGVRAKGVFHRYLSRRSKDNLWMRLAFFSTRGPLLLRITALPRYPLVVAYRRLKRLVRG